MMLSAAEIEALLLSLRISSVAVVGSLPLALACALLLARPRFPGKLLVDGLVHLPLVLPPVVMGYLLLITLGTRAPVGGWLFHTFGIRLVFNWTGAAVAAAVVTFPFQVRAMRLALESIDPQVVAAARSLGAARLDVFFTITLPLMLPGIVAGADHCLCRQPRRVRRDHHLRLQRARRDADAAARHLLRHPVARQRERRRRGWRRCRSGLPLSGLLLSELAGRRARRLVGR